MSSIDERRRAAFDKLEAIVQELSDIDDADPSVGFDQPNVVSGWVLVAGFDAYDDQMNPDGGAIAIYPKDGCQAPWKTLGLLAAAQGRMQ